MMSQKVLIVDDSGYSRTLVRRQLESSGYEIVGEAKNGLEALDQIDLLKPDLITLDNILPDMTGLDILKAMKENGIKSKVIMISAVGQLSAIEEAKSLGVLSYLIKPFDESKLIEAVKKAFDH